jgi:hypothetical protein
MMVTFQAEYKLETCSQLASPATLVWGHARTIEGVNDELFPLCRMTNPGISSIDEVAPGECLGRSWILLFGILPIDFDDITIVSIGNEGGFVEVSEMFTQHEWRHERWILPAADGCVVTDRIAFRPRVHALGWLHLAAFRLAFWNRHRRLRKRFGRKA